MLIENKGSHVTTGNMSTVCERRQATTVLLSTLVGQMSCIHYNFINTCIAHKYLLFILLFMWYTDLVLFWNA